MAALPSPTLVAGSHTAVYEAYYNQLDPNGTGVIRPMDAARFLKKSKLSDVILSKVWDMSDPTGRGFLDKNGLFVALKLVALAQAGRDVSMPNVVTETPPPKLGELPKVPPPPAAAPPSTGDWSIKPAERDKYNQLFEKLEPVNGLIPGNKVKGLLMDSKLPLPTLGKIWDLADQDKDGMLDRHEFVVAMHLVYKALEKHAIPAVLPPELRPPSKPTTGPPVRPPSRPVSPTPVRPPPPVSHAPVVAPPPKPPLPMNGGAAFSQAPLIPGLAGPVAEAKPWVVTPAEKRQYDALFVEADVDMDGFVSGMEIKDTFLQSGLPQPCLAHIWSLCDWDSSGKLSCDQFALAMWMVQRKLRGIEPPATLAPDMIPPSARDASSQPPTKEKEISLGPQPTPEMEALARDMEQLARERLALESEVATKEQSIRVKTSEANSLQSELDTLAATLKQLENQRGEAQKRLNDLQAQVEKLRLQVNTQESAVKAAESEAASRRDVIQGLKNQEQQLEDELKQQNMKIDSLNDELQQSVLAISQANLKITHLEEQEKQASEAADAVEQALTGGLAPSQQHLSLAPPLTPNHLARVVQGSTPNDLDSDGDTFGNMNGPKGMGGGFSSDPFKDDPFTSKDNANDPFAASFPSNKSNSGFTSDPFASSFGNSASDPFGGDAFDSAKDNKTKVDDNKDPFGCDPFAILHAPTRDGSSPTPSLPPKKQKQPPPRPAPPRPQQPSQASFSADFSNFNNKLSSGGPTSMRHTSAASKSKSAMDFTEDPFRDYRYEDPFNLEDPFADVTDSNRNIKGKSTHNTSLDAFNMSGAGNSFKSKNTSKNSFSAFDMDDFFSTSASSNNNNSSDVFGGRQSVPLPSNDPFNKNGRVSAPINNDNWSTWGNNGRGNNWGLDDAYGTGDDNWANLTTNSDATNANSQPKSSSKSSKYELWSKSNTSKSAEKDKSSLKKEKSPKSGNRYTWGNLRNKNKSNSNNNNNNNNNNLTLPGSTGLPSEEQQIAWATAESKKLEESRKEQNDQYEQELKLALSLSVGNTR